MRRLMKHRYFILWLLTALMLFSSVDLGRAMGSISWLSNKEIPLSCNSYQLSISQKYRDISTSEITGNKNSGAISHKMNVRRVRTLYHPTELLHPCLTLPFEVLASKCQTILRPAIRVDANETIIHYIHDQDGEKDNSFLYL